MDRVFYDKFRNRTLEGRLFEEESKNKDHKQLANTPSEKLGGKKLHNVQRMLEPISPTNRKPMLSITHPKKSKFSNAIKQNSSFNLTRPVHHIITIPPHNPKRRAEHSIDHLLLLSRQHTSIQPLEHLPRTKTNAKRVGNLSSNILHIKMFTFPGTKRHHLVSTAPLGNTMLSIHLLVSLTTKTPS
ncbi:hypothetical protein LXL04_027880 [Taraxacum kok-saghyz]